MTGAVSLVRVGVRTQRHFYTAGTHGLAMKFVHGLSYTLEGQLISAVGGKAPVIVRAFKP